MQHSAIAQQKCDDLRGSIAIRVWDHTAGNGTEVSVGLIRGRDCPSFLHGPCLMASFCCGTIIIAPEPT
jgi:hypothetical protein